MTTVYYYNLQAKSLVAKYKSECNWIHSIAVHPMGTNFVLGTLDNKIIWFDMELGTKPYKILSVESGVRDVKFHEKYPIFSAAQSDGNVHIIHAKVFENFENVQIVPISKIKTHDSFNSCGKFN